MPSSLSKLNPNEVLPKLTRAESSELLPPLELPLSLFDFLRNALIKFNGIGPSPAVRSFFSLEFEVSRVVDMVLLVCSAVYATIREELVETREVCGLLVLVEYDTTGENFNTRLCRKRDFSQSKESLSTCVQSAYVTNLLNDNEQKRETSACLSCWLVHSVKELNSSINSCRNLSLFSSTLSVSKRMAFRGYLML